DVNGFVQFRNRVVSDVECEAAVGLTGRKGEPSAGYAIIQPASGGAITRLIIHPNREDVGGTEVHIDSQGRGGLRDLVVINISDRGRLRVQGNRISNGGRNIAGRIHE